MGEGSFKRELPEWIPTTTARLQAKGITPWAMRRDYARVSKGVWVPKEREAEAARCIVTRARAQWLAVPLHPITGFAALALFGLNYWADDAEVVVASKDARPRRPPSGSALARVEPSRHTSMIKPDRFLPDLLCVDEPEAVVSALKMVKSGEISWEVPDYPGWDPDELRGVQLLDAVRRLLGHRLRMDKLLKRADHRIRRQWLEKVISSSSPLADSPQETLLRLALSDLTVNAVATEWEPQVAIYGDGVMAESGSSRRMLDENGQWIPWLTLGDLVCRKLKIVLFYDGEHHRYSRQHYRDTEIDAVLQSKGYRVLRLTAPMLYDRDTLRARVAALIEMAMKELDALDDTV